MIKVLCFILCFPLCGKAQNVTRNTYCSTSLSTLLLQKSPAFNINNNAKVSSIKSPGSVMSVRTDGIKWVEGLSFQVIKEKAAQENKYIFLDCYTTWCEPCKMMDKSVYINDSVGEYFNQRFISVKVQMDKTPNDNEQVRNRYEDVASLYKLYKIEAFPCFIILSPQSQILDIQTGYLNVSKFLAMAQLAIKPGKVYNDPYAEYKMLVDDYKKGIVHYDRMVYMIKAASKFDTVLARPLTMLYTDYLSTLDASKRYTKENIIFWCLNGLKINSEVFQFFYKDGNKIDKIMQQRGYARAEIDKAIYKEIVRPFLREQNSNPAIPIEGMYLSGPGVKTDLSEADWQKLKVVLRQKFNSNTTNRNVLAAKIEWYKRHWNDLAFCKHKLIQIRKFCPDIKTQVISINVAAWSAFLHVSDKYILNEYIKWMKKLKASYPQSGFLLDTYANLLYKVGRIPEAIMWEEKALLVGDSDAEGYKKALEQMRRGEPTYGVKM